MIRKISKNNMYLSEQGWLQSRFHFSFAEYRNPKNINFGALRVLNDDYVKAQTGFDMHPHRDMEIVSYIVDGEITHKDSMGNEETLRRGEVQYMSAGRGVFHSEHNRHQNKTLRLLQIWILPPKHNLPTLYGSKRFKENERQNKLLHFVSNQKGKAPVKLYQDVNMFVSELERGKSLSYELKEDRQLYFTQIEGSSTLNDVELHQADAAEVSAVDTLHIQAKTNSHFLMIEMAKPS